MFNLLKRRIHLPRQLGQSKSFYDEISEEIEKIQRNVKKPKTERYEPRTSKKGQCKDVANEGNPEQPTNLNPEDRVKRKKFCLLLCYSGANYFGMQRNRHLKTIEEELLVAMMKHKWITEESYKQPKLVEFQRASRTDRGVSAARQCVSMKLPYHTTDTAAAAAVNQDLPDDIKIFGVKRVTKGFDTKKTCDARTYTYTLPTISFADHEENISMEAYRVPNEKFDQLNSLLKMFEGTKNFHNFTSQKEYADPSANRYIVSFSCAEPFVDKTTNIEFAVIKIKGKSFMLHQIRKMIGLTLAIVRGLAKQETLTRAFTSERIEVPMAPGLGLVLDQVHYDRYNTRYGTDGMHEALDWINEKEQIQKFFDDHIFPTIVNTEKTEKSMVSWLEILHLHSFDVKIGSGVEESSIRKDEDVDDDKTDDDNDDI